MLFKCKGLSLIELVISILILSIIAIVIIGKFINLDRNSQISILKHIKSVVENSNNMLHAKSVIMGIEDCNSNIGDIKIKKGNILINRDNLLKLIETNVNIVNESEYGIVITTGNEQKLEDILINSCYLAIRNEYDKLTFFIQDEC